MQMRLAEGALLLRNKGDFGWIQRKGAKPQGRKE